MKTEIIFVGTELLLGQILNSNAVFLSKELALLGYDCHFQTIVGDNTERLQEVIKIAFKRADLIITTGGLGPTSDDLTIESIASMFEEEMILDEQVLQHIQKLFAQRNKVMVDSNKKQAYRPKTADLLPNPEGTAPGIIWDLTEQCLKHKIITSLPQNKKILMTFPGVPKEMKAMWKETAYPFLANLNENKNKLFYKELKFYGIGESALAERVQDLLNMEEVTVAPLAGYGECRLRIATKAENEKEYLKKIQPIQEQITNRVGEFIYGEDNQTLESVVAEKLIKNNLTISIAESCTGGLLSKRLTDIPGSSQYTKLNIITYSNQSKINMLGVSNQTIDKYGAVSQEVAIEMVKGIKKLAQTDLGIAITGIAGPNSDCTDKPIGLVFIAIINKNNEQIVKQLNLGQMSREDVRWYATQEALDLLRK